MKATPAQPPLLTANYLCACAANFLLNFPFYLIVPILPLYLIERFQADNTLIGIILSCFMLSALIIRPFSGFLLDITARKPHFLAAYACIIGVYCGYMFAATTTMLIVVRLAHGLFLGSATTAGNTLVIDIMPSQRRGEGLGYFGMMSNLAMALGPMTGMFLHDTYAANYNLIFITAIASCAAGWLVAALIKAPPKPRAITAPISLDRFILLKGLRGGSSLLLMAIPYAMMTGFIAIFTQEVQITSGAAYFFVFFSAGIITSRIFSGKQIDRGKLTTMISSGTLLAAIAFLMMGLTAHLPLTPTYLKTYFFATAAFLGLSYGMIFPAYNTLFVNLARPNQRGTASSTYMTSWDIGIGSGLLLGGAASAKIGLAHVYMLGAAACLASLALFNLLAAPHYNTNKLR